MKKNNILLLIIIFLISCGQPPKGTVSIMGEIEGLGTDTLYLYGMDELRDRIDTIYAQDDKFVYTTTVDTITPAFLLIHQQTEYPIYLDKGNKIKIKGDVRNLNHLHIDGNLYNEEFTTFQDSIEQLKTSDSFSEKTLVQKAEEFIEQHRSSFVSLYLLDKYFVQQDSVDLQKIKRLTEMMTGILQDKNYIEQLNEIIPLTEKAEIGKYAPFFSLPNAKGERVSRSAEKFRKKCLLLHFWASWNNHNTIARHTANAELRELYKKYKKSEYFALLGISLDIDKEQWTTAIEQDTLEWEQVCDFGGFDSEVVKQYAVRQLPFNILLSTDGRILGKGLTGEVLKEKVKEAVSAAEEKEKERKKKTKK